MEPYDLILNHGQGSLHFPWKRHKSICSLPNYGKIVFQIGFFCLDKVTSLRE